MKRITSAFALLAASMLALACGGSPNETTGDDNSDLIGGTATFEHPEVGLVELPIPSKPGWAEYCTGTLVAPNVVLTASHCVDYKSKGPGNYGKFYIDRSASERHAFGIVEIHAYSSDLGRNDISLLRLGSVVPASVAWPAAISATHPPNGINVADFGYGCTTLNHVANNGFGTKRVFIHVQGGPILALCPGDSGGPMMWSGGIFAVNSGYNYRSDPTKPTSDIFADAVDLRGGLESQIAAWNRGGNGGAGCHSDTLGRDVPMNTCVQSRANELWYQCDNGSWVDRWSDPAACVAQYPLFSAGHGGLPNGWHVE